MKNILRITAILLIVGITMPSIAQKSVTESINYAEKLNKKIKKRRFKKFKTNYETALSDMANIEAGANDEFGHDKIADNINNWIKLNTILSSFDGGTISYKDESITLKVKDYSALKEVAFTTAAQDHYNAAMKIINEKESYDDKKASFKHFKKCSHYDIAKVHTDKIIENKTIVHYNEGLRLYESGANYEEKSKSITYFNRANKLTPNYNNNNDLVLELYYNEGVRMSALASFNERKQCVTYFKMANEITPNYKENNEISAKVFFDEAQKLSDSESIDDLKYSKGLLETTKRYSADYSGSEELYATVCEKGASILYEQANTAAEEESFKGQKEASLLYKNIIDNWMKDYEDVVEKEMQTRNNSSIHVFIVSADGSINTTKALTNGNIAQLEQYIRVNDDYELLEGLDMNNTDNYESAKEKVGYGFVLIKLSDETDEPQVNSYGPTTSTKTITKYYQKSPKNDMSGDYETKEISKSEYEKGKKVLELTDPNGSKTHISLFTKEGTITTISEQSIASKTYIIEVLDARDPSSPDQIKTLNFKLTAKDEILQQTYSGASETKPSKLSKDERELKSDEDLINQLGTANIKSIVTENKDKYISILNKIEYRNLQ